MLPAATRFTPAVGDEDLKREKARARELRRSAWWKRRIAAGCCHYCGRQVGSRRLSMDHVVPLIRGGQSRRGNVVPACKACNNKKKSLLPVEWEEYLTTLAEREEA
ncbi:MAG: HNH endonuclease [Candidatus Rokubacteria bacterium]|nr:HNH endonuclease [Candidatus Rokubacteria bacterium]